MSKEERYVEHIAAWELPNGDSVTKSNYNLADIETKYMPIQTEVICDDKDKTITDLKAKLAESETQLKEEIEEKNGVRRALTACNRQNDEFADMIKKLENEKEELKHQLAIEELEKLKYFFLEPYKDEEMDTDYLITKDAGEIADYLLDQIKQLKEMK